MLENDNWNYIDVEAYISFYLLLLCRLRILLFYGTVVDIDLDRDGNDIVIYKKTTKIIRRCNMNKLNLMILPFAVAFLAMFFLGNAVKAQETPPEIEIPFIDRDGDGINDLLQNGWGLRFMNRYKKRHELWEQLNIEIIRNEDGAMVDTDGDGVGDIAFGEYMKSKMDELIDTDGDGVADTPLKEYLGGRFRAFDRDGDGLPDDFSREEMKEFMQNMKEWRKTIRDRIKQGLPAFVDEDGDGVPDGLPNGFGWRGFKRGR